MRIPVTIDINDGDHSVCGEECPFLNGSDCVLFEQTLNYTRLAPGYEWNDTPPTKDRCYPCQTSFNS